jgi:RNA polymerase sigma-70 factor (ECF subfamily)
MPTVDVFDRHRSELFGLAYRMLGSIMSAEDILQEAFLRWQNASRVEDRSSKVYLTTIVTRLCIDHLRLAHVEREQYVGAWLPEPLLQSTADNPQHIVKMDESITTTFLLRLENLSPLDRAVFLLHDVFNYTFAEIATIVNRNSAHCRQIGHRARWRLEQNCPRFDIDTRTVETAAQQFIRACTSGDMHQLFALLAPDAAVWTDSGGKVRAVRNMIIGREKVARLLLGLSRKWSPRMAPYLAMVNGQPAVVECVGKGITCVTTFAVSGGKIHALYRVLNPDKLRDFDCMQEQNKPAEANPEQLDADDQARIDATFRRIMSDLEW